MAILTIQFQDYTITGSATWKSSVPDIEGGSGLSRVDWGPSGKTRMNPWVTLDALRVLEAHGY